MQTLNALGFARALARQPDAHKGDSGRVLLIGGAPTMAGALVLAGECWWVRRVYSAELVEGVLGRAGAAAAGAAGTGGEGAEGEGAPLACAGAEEG